MDLGLVSVHHKDQTIIVHQHLQTRFIQITRSMSHKVVMKYSTINMSMKIGLELMILRRI